MNIHHLELFYYVAKHGGIMPAVRNIPYGIQQPAVSGQIIELEEDLGTTLFQRRPFQLTPAGQELYAFIKPFFENVEPMAEKLRGGVSQHLRIAASEIVLRDHLPSILQDLRRQFPKLKVTLRGAYTPQMVQWLEEREIDVCIGVVNSHTPAGVESRAMFKIPPVLIVPKNSKIKSAEELWAMDRIEETLITVPRDEFVTRVFQAGLARLKVDWFVGIEVATLELVQTYVVNGYGIGLTVGVPKMKYHPQVRVLPLEGFEPAIFGVMWQSGRNPVLEGLVKSVEKAARKLMEGEDEALMLLK